MEYNLKDLLIRILYEKLVFTFGRNFRLTISPMFNSNLGPVWFLNDKFYCMQKGHALVNKNSITLYNYNIYKPNALEISNWVHLLYYLNINPQPVLDSWLCTNYSGGVEIQVWPPIQLNMVSENNTYSITASYPDLSKYSEISGEWC